MKPYVLYLLVCIVGIATALPTVATGQPTIVVAFSEFPPYKVLDEGQVGGIDVEILYEIAGRMNRGLTFKQGTFEDCLEMMAKGEADVMTSLLRRPDREAYLLYVLPRYRPRSEKIFFVRTEDRGTVRAFDDLKSLRIGVKSGANYGPMFDNDESLNKISADSIKINISKLVAGQIDTFLTTDLEGDYWIRKLGLEDRIVRAPFKLTHLDEIYMAISKKSALADEVEAFGAILNDLVKTGAIQKIEDRYRKP